MTYSRGKLRFGDTTIEFELRRSSRRTKTVQITVKDGEVRVAAPSTLSDGDVRDIVRQRAAWIVDRLSEPKPQLGPSRFSNGDLIPYLGRETPLTIQPAKIPTATLRFRRGRFLVSTPSGLAGNEQDGPIHDAIAKWYWDRASERLPACVALWRGSFQVKDQPRILIGAQRSFWGSCSPGGTLRFSWRVMMLEPSLIDYIVVHELAHLKVPNHSPNYWSLVSQVLPDVKERRRGLREAEKGLPL